MQPKHLSGGHWYNINGEPCHYVEKKAGGLRPTTLADARKLNLLPSVTTLLKCLDKPALNEWRIRNAIEATLTTPRLPDEPLDEFAARIMAVDVESVSDAAKERGTAIHDALEECLSNGDVKGLADDYEELVSQSTVELSSYVLPALNAINEIGKPVIVESVLIGKGYAGRVDCVLENVECMTIIDFKTTGAKKLPAKSYTEHRLQLSAYAAALGNTANKRIQTANLYISTTRPGEIALAINEDWQADYKAFGLVAELWQILNSYTCNQTINA